MGKVRNPAMPSEFIEIPNICGEKRPAGPSLRKEFIKVKKENRLSDLMDCRKIDKFFGTEHQFTPVAKPLSLFSIGRSEASMYMSEGICIIKSEFCNRTLYRAGEPFATLTQNVLDSLISSGEIRCITSPSDPVSIYEAI